MEGSGRQTQITGLVVEGCPAIDANGEYELDTIGTQAGKPRFVKPGNWFRGVYVVYREEPEPMWVMTYDPVLGPQSAKSTFAKSPASAGMERPPNGKDVRWMVVQPKNGSAGGWQVKENMRVIMQPPALGEEPSMPTPQRKPGMLKGLDADIELLLKEIFDSIDKNNKGSLSKDDLMDSALVQRELPFLSEQLAVVEADGNSITYEMFKDFVMREAAGLMKIRVIREKFNKFAQSKGSRRGQTLVIKAGQVRELIETEFPSLCLNVSELQAAFQRMQEDDSGTIDCDAFVECITDLMEYLQYRLAQVVGLESLKYRLTAFCQGAILDKRRSEYAEKEGRHFFPTAARHMIFRGNSGTGKTTLAKIVGDILWKAGLVKRNVFVYVQREDLVGSVVGRTAQLTKQKVDEAKGGILFIDEAYRLCPKGADGKDFGKEAIDELMAAMLIEGGPIMIFAGYPKLMDGFIQANPGLRSRIPNSFDFEDFSWIQLSLVLDQIVERTGFRWADSVRLQQVAEVLRRRTPPGAAESMNGRMCELVFMFAKQMLDKRLLDLAGSHDPEQLFELTLNDICDGCTMVPRPADPRIAFRQPEEEDMELEDVQHTGSWLNLKLGKLTGLPDLKDQIRLLQSGVALDQERARQGRKVAISTLNHMVFAGNPGTGKTTVARIMAELLHRCGVIKTRKLVEVQREAFIGKGMVGSAEAATAEVIESAKDGVLFVDEAYRLCEDDVGRQAIQAIMTHMLAPDAPVIIFASYFHGMESFLQRNPGLAARIPYRFTFDDHSSTTLATILRSNIDKMGLDLAPEVTDSDISTIFEGCPMKARTQMNGHLCQFAAKFAKDCLDRDCDEQEEVSWELSLEHVKAGVHRAAAGRDPGFVQPSRHSSLLGA